MPGEVVVVQSHRIRTADDSVVVISAFAVGAGDGHGGLLATYRVARRKVGALHELCILAFQFFVLALQFVRASPAPRSPERRRDVARWCMCTFGRAESR